LLEDKSIWFYQNSIYSLAFFFSEVGANLLESFSDKDQDIEKIGEKLK